MSRLNEISFEKYYERVVKSSKTSILEQQLHEPQATVTQRHNNVKQRRSMERTSKAGDSRSPPEMF